MPRRIQTTVDGIAVDHFRARWTGSVDLEETEANATALDEVGVFVVVGRVKDVQNRLDRSGDVARVAVLQATDTRVIEGELRELLVNQLGLHGSDTIPPALVPEPLLGDDQGDDEDDEEDTPSPDVPHPREEEDVQDGVIGSIHDRAPDARPVERDSRVSRFSGDTVGTPTGTVIGRIGRNDPALAKYLDE